MPEFSQGTARIQLVIVFPERELFAGSTSKERGHFELSDCYLLYGCALIRTREREFPMNRFIIRSLAIFLLAAGAAPVLVAGTVRTVDFESPALIDRPWEHVWEAYDGYEATFEYGIRYPPLDGYTTSRMYWGGAGICGNCDYGPIRIYFSKPVKNIHFTLYDYFGAYGGPIRWDTREFFTDIPRSVMYVDPYMSSREFRSITVPGEHVRYLDIDTGHFIALDDFSFEVEDDATVQTFARFGDVAYLVRHGQDGRRDPQRRPRLVG